MLPELFWLESLIHFELPSCDYAFCGDVLAILENFSVRVAVFSFSLSMYLSPASIYHAFINSVIDIQIRGISI